MKFTQLSNLKAKFWIASFQIKWYVFPFSVFKHGDSFCLWLGWHLSVRFMHSQNICSKPYLSLGLDHLKKSTDTIISLLLREHAISIKRNLLLVWILNNFPIRDKLSIGPVISFWTYFSVWILLKNEAEKAEDMKSRLILEKMEENDAKTHAQQEMLACVAKLEEYQRECTQSIDAVQVILRGCWEEIRSEYFPTNYFFHILLSRRMISLSMANTNRI